jgi:sucrose-6-phosphate hydrolase SacC (GH32 family)
MTTTVTIAAHLSSQKEVHVKISDNGNIVEEFTLQDGETTERHIYDGREITAIEVAMDDADAKVAQLKELNDRTSK